MNIFRIIDIIYKNKCGNWHLEKDSKGQMWWVSAAGEMVKGRNDARERLFYSEQNKQANQ